MARHAAAHEDTPSAGPEGQALCHRVRELRHRRRWTLEQMAAASGVSRSMLSEIERGDANPTVTVACRIARALGCSVGELVDAPTLSSRIDVIRSDDRAYHFRSDRQCRIRTLSPLHLEKSVEFYEIALQRGRSLQSKAHFHGAQELLSVLLGKVRVHCGDETQELSSGDSAHYPADVDHAIENPGAAEAVVYLVVSYAPDR